MTEETGLAFSGGSIRSAAFCSGVLRRLLQRNTKIDYLSCVSGGGYTGTAYLDWKYRHEKKDDPKWHRKFFDHMEERAGYFCQWNTWREGIGDTIILFLLVLVVTFIAPIVIYGSYACPIAFIIDFLFGKLLREKVDCDDVAATQSRRNDLSTQSAADQNATIDGEAIREHCLDRQGTDGTHTIILFSVLFALFILFLVLSKRCSTRRWYSAPLRFILTALIALLALTFFPFAIHDFLITFPVWTQYLFVFIGVMVWFFLPLLRSKTSYVLLIYFYSYVTYWKVYEARLLGIKFSGELFNRLLFVSGFALWIVPFLSVSHKRLVHVYNRWRLQKAFYDPDGLGTTGCSGITMQDICPAFIACQSQKLKYRKVDDKTKTIEALNLKDLKDMKPEYLSNIVVNRWKENENSDENYELLTMSPTEIDRLDRDPDTQTRTGFEDKLEPADIKLSDAMATSAAAVSEHMGKYDLSVHGLSRFHTLFGLEMGASIITDIKAVRMESVFCKILPFLVDILRGLPLICVPALYYSGRDHVASIERGVISFFVIHLALASIAAIPTGSEEPTGWLEKIARWFIVHNDFVNFVREMFSKSNHGPMPPPVMLLSDGGHFENLALLPLLKKRLKKIIVVDGGYKNDIKLYGESLLNALMLAREKLGCSFLSYKCGDVISDLMENFVKPNADGKYPRHYKFKVQYKSDKSASGSGAGEILLIAPRNPEDGLTDERDGSRSTDEPDGPTPEDIKRLTFCCCECCHRTSCHGCSSWLCNVFPQHITANQFFTPRMFKAYHSEGYWACDEAKADEFINGSQQGENCVTLEMDTCMMYP